MNIINTFPGNPGVASSNRDGLMSKEDKTNLDSAMKRINTLETNYVSLLAKVKTAVFWEDNSKE